MPDGSVILVEIARPDADPGHARRQASTSSPSWAAVRTVPPWGPEGKIYVTNNGGFNWIERPDGRLFPGTVSADYKGGSIQVVDPRDRKVRDALRFLQRAEAERAQRPGVSTMPAASGSPISARTRERDNDRGAVYYARARRLEDRGEGLPAGAGPNGCGLSPDGKTLYVVETADRALLGLRAPPRPGVIKDANGPYRGEKGRVIGGPGRLPDVRFRSPSISAGHICVATLITRRGQRYPRPTASR